MDGAVALFESSSLPSPSSAALSFPTRSDYSTFLNESIPHFLTLSQTPASDFSSNFRSVFFRLINSSPDPPIEVLWFYSAVVYRDSIASSKEMEAVSTEISGVRDLLQMLITSSATWTGVRSIALVAPVIFEACRVVRELDEGREGRRKVWKEMDELVDGIIGYICICCVKKEQKEEHESTISLLPCFGDVVRVWMVKSKDEENWVRQFFPLISVEIYDELVRDGSLFGGDVEYLASVVCVQAFMLKLFLKFRSGRASEMKDLGNELRVWAVSSITGIGSIRFFGNDRL